MKVDPALVRRLRLRKSWSQEMLAEKAGLNLRTVQRIESSGAASLRTRRSLATALGVDPSALGPAWDDPDASVREPGERSRALTPRRSILVGLYACSVVMLLGFVVLDQVYAYTIDSQLPSARARFALSEVADFLLQFKALSFLVAIGALSAAWKHGSVRGLVIASVLAGTVLPVLFMLVVNNALPGVWQHMDENGFGAVLRFSLHALAAALAVSAWMASAGAGERRARA